MIGGTGGDEPLMPVAGLTLHASPATPRPHGRGAGTIVVAGVVLSPGVLGVLAGAMGSYSAVEAIIAAYVC